jgi:hypothetical protein
MNARRLLDPLILEIGPHTFKHVHTFTYLDTKINKENYKKIRSSEQNRRSK